MRLLVLVAILVAITGVPLSSSAAVVFVRSDSPGPVFDGSSWDAAFHTVQAGIDKAVSGDEVWVARGIYAEKINVKSGVLLYGGFFGNETARDQRDWTSNASVLEGTWQQAVVNVPTGGTNPVVVDGFTIRKGPQLYGTTGSGVNAASPVVVSHNKIIGNNGIGVSCNSAGTQIVSNNVITGNGGTGIYAKGGTTIVSNNVVSGNSSPVDVGGIYCAGTSATIANNTVFANFSTKYGSVSTTLCTALTIANNVVAFNSSGFYNSSSPYAVRSNCIFGNTEYNYSGIVDQTGINGNISVDPKLASSAYGNPHIQPDSPCRDAGDDTAVQPGWLDMDGQPRLQGLHVDIGADESDGSTWDVTPTVVRVSPDGNDANDGSGWDKAKKTIQAGIDAASMQGGEVWVRAGVYSETLTLRMYAYLYGGFAGTETSRGERTGSAGAAIIEADPTATYSVTADSLGYLLSCFDGFFIRGGHGMLVTNASFAVTNNTISVAEGGAIAVTSSAPTIAGNTITSEVRTDYTRLGGAIKCTSSLVTVANNTISDPGGKFGGAISLIRSSGTVAGNRVSGCSGGIMLSSPLLSTITSTVRGNTVSKCKGQGILVSGSSATIQDNVLTLDVAGIVSTDVLDLPTKISNNTVKCCGASGIRLSKSKADVTNNLVTGCGGGIDCWQSYPMVVSGNTIVGNTDLAGLKADYRLPLVVNNLIAFNGSGCLMPATGINPMVFKNNCIFGNTEYNYSGIVDQTGINGNISVDPKLASSAYGNPHIQPDSPCRDAGDDTAVQPGWLDMDGQPRLQGLHVDIGADESDGSTWDVTPTVVRVSPDGNDANDGSGWDKAKKTIQAGIDAASMQGGEVWVGAGTYPETVSLRAYAYLYGGFAGTEAERSQRDWRRNASVIDGQRKSSTVSILSGHMNHCIDGFTIRNGYASDGYGGGIHDDAATTIANNIITANEGRAANSPGGGGGIWVRGRSLIRGNTIVNNSVNSTGGFGGGIFCTSSAAVIADNAILMNTGGGIGCDGHSTNLLVNNTIAGNYGKLGDSGIACSNYSMPKLVNNIIALNGYGVTTDVDSMPVLKGNCVFNQTSNYVGFPTDPTATDGNISADPEFANLGLANCHIQPGSPCQDSGIDSEVPAGDTDIDGQPRIQGTHVDMGADESDGTVWNVTPGVVRVSPDGNDTNDGSSWDRPKKTIQAAVDSISASAGEVWVRKGTYYGHLNVRALAYLYGGFAGTETERPQRNWAANPTILDGQRGVTDIVSMKGCGTFCAIDGFTIGNGDKYNAVCIRSDYSSPEVSHNILSSAQSGFAALYSDADVHDNLMFDNTVGIYMGGYGHLGRIAGNTVVRNRTGISIGSSCQHVVESNIVAFNVTGVSQANASPTLRSNCVYGNTTNYSGLSAGVGDMSADPLFADRASGDFHLLPGSPCIDAGNPAASGVDLDGIPYPKDGNGDGTAVADIGCYETPANYVSPAAAKALADGSPVGVACVSSAIFTDRFYLENFDRASGIGILGGCSSTGRRIVVEGAVTTIDGERLVVPAVISEGPTSVVPGPLFLTLNSLGGGPVGLQDGVMDYRLVKEDNRWVRDVFAYGGANNIGLLVKVSGRVTHPAADSFYLDGFCSFDDGDSEIVGVKVIWPFAAPLPAEHSLVSMEAISSCTIKNGVLVRLLRPTSAEGVTVLEQ